MAKYQVVKTFGHDLGFSCAFRQWRAESHCRFMHGYALAIELTFEATQLDARNWVIDFGNFKELKEQLKHQFDHKTLVAKDDPELNTFKKLHQDGAINLYVVDRVGCESFAKLVYDTAARWLADTKQAVSLVSCKVSEHGANSAVYIGGEQ
jgi:6-pyruvoyltetrahydropterin/6-carboxytetrahydropterin synthase